MCWGIRSGLVIRRPSTQAWGLRLKTPLNPYYRICPNKRTDPLSIIYWPSEPLPVITNISLPLHVIPLQTVYCPFFQEIEHITQLAFHHFSLYTFSASNQTWHNKIHESLMRPSSEWPWIVAMISTAHWYGFTKFPIYHPSKLALWLGIQKTVDILSSTFFPRLLPVCAIIWTNTVSPRGGLSILKGFLILF